MNEVAVTGDTLLLSRRLLKVKYRMYLTPYGTVRTGTVVGSCSKIFESTRAVPNFF